MPANTDKLIKMLELLKEGEDYAKVQDVARLFAVLVPVVKAIEPELAKKLSTSLEEFTSLLEKKAASLSKELQAGDAQVEASLKRIISGLREEMDGIREDVRFKITGNDLQAAFDAFRSTLPESEPHDCDECHKRLDEMEEKIGAMKPAAPSSTVIVQSRGAVKGFDISDQLDGNKKTFALPAFGWIITVQSTSNPTVFRPGVDYTVDAAAMTVTFTNEIDAPTTLAPGQTVVITYAEN